MRTHLDVSRDLAAPPGAAWEVLVDTRRWADWGPSIAAVRADPPVIAAGSRGAIRPRLGVPVGVWVPFVVTAFAPDERWAWRVAGVPATGHRVEPTATGCRVVFEVPLVAAGYALVCRRALRRIADLVEGPAGGGAGRDR